jgi:predicted metal-dependent phosphoesterase TrpH
MERKSIYQFFGRFLLFFVVAGGIIAVSVVINVMGPSRSLYSDDSWKDVAPYTAPNWNQTAYKGVLDQHSHTLYSDGKLTVHQNIEWHIAMGFNIVFITDHNNMNNRDDIAAVKAEYLAKGIVVIQGMEWTTARIHMNFLGLKKWELPIPSNPTDDDIQAAIQAAHDQNAVVTCNHIPWSLNQAKMTNHPSREQLLSWGIDYIEIVNDDSAPENMYDEASVKFCEENGLGQITGTDMHRPDQLEAGGVHGWTLVNCTELTEEAVMEALRARKTKIIFYENGFVDNGRYESDPNYFYVKPLAEFGGLFRALWGGNGLDPSGVAIYIAYFVGLFLLFEIIQLTKSGFWVFVNKKRNSK